MIAVCLDSNWMIPWTPLQYMEEEVTQGHNITTSRQGPHLTWKKQQVGCGTKKHQ